MQDATLEIQFTSRNKDTITEIKGFYLKNIESSQMENTKDQSFRDIKCVTPNLFLFENVISGKYFGLIHVESNGRRFNVSIDSIIINPGKNYIIKEMNLGTVSLP